MKTTLFILFVLLVSCEQMQTSILTNTFTDERDGQTYATIEIGGQIWMAENLAYIDYDYYPDTIDFKVLLEAPLIPLFYDNGDYGVLYNWHASAIVAPNGWHVPSEEDWDRLINYVGGYDVAGLKLKKTNQFAALSGGVKIDESPNHKQGQLGAWWGAGSSDEQWQYIINFTGEDCITMKDRNDSNAFARYLSIRCVKDY